MLYFVALRGETAWSAMKLLLVSSNPNVHRGTLTPNSPDPFEPIRLQTGDPSFDERNQHRLETC